jgi:prepilin-type N-terminal cleavage/methylation domain-containing protein
MEMTRRQSLGFTLVEMMAAVAVMAVVMVLLSQLVGSISRIIDFSKRRMDAVSQLAFALDRIDADLRRAVQRRDLLPYLAKHPGNDEWRFYSQVPGYGGDRTLSIVSYFVGTWDGESQALNRGASGRDWSGVQSVVFSTADTAGAPAFDPQDNQVLAPAVYRFEIGFVNAATGNYVEAPAQADWSDVSGVVVVLAAIDDANRKLLGSSGETAIQKATGWLEDFPAAGPSPAAQWQAVLDAKAAESDLASRVMGRSWVRQRVYEW